MSAGPAVFSGAPGDVGLGRAGHGDSGHVKPRCGKNSPGAVGWDLAGGAGGAGKGVETPRGRNSVFNAVVVADPGAGVAQAAGRTEMRARLRAVNRFDIVQRLGQIRIAEHVFQLFDHNTQGHAGRCAFEQGVEIAGQVATLAGVKRADNGTGGNEAVQGHQRRLHLAARGR